MAILKVARMGHPILRVQTKDMSADEIVSAPVQQLVDNMIETMREYDGIGLAAPQVHEDKRLFIVELKSENAGNTPVIPLTILFNFRVTTASKDEALDWEGCLSIPGLRGLVPRPKSIEVEALDRNAKKVKFKASGFFARMLLHEGDHLDGILYPERMHDLRSLAFVEELQKYPPTHA